MEGGGGGGGGGGWRGVCNHGMVPPLHVYVSSIRGLLFKEGIHHMFGLMLWVRPCIYSVAA